jgi:glycosyltransferase involved in cell wall biosynthesis
MYYKPVNSRTASDLEKGLRQVRDLANVAELNMAVSAFNARELVDMGYVDVRVHPLTLNFTMLDATPDRSIIRRYGDGRVNVLFVGRLAPNKAIEDLVAAFAVYRHAVQPRSRLIHVGSYAGAERYFQMVRKRAQDLGVGDTVFAGAVSQEKLNAFYRIASVFVSMSEHEGFCIPLIESMHMGVPVLAYAAGAVPETVDGAGVLFTQKRFQWIAEMIDLLAGDTPLRRSVIEGQTERVRRYRSRDSSAALMELMRPLLPVGLPGVT